MLAMLHVVTVHHKSPRWVPIQHRYLQRFVDIPFRTWAVVDDIPQEARATFDVVVELEGDHGDRLNHLAAMVLADSSPDDWILFLDSDALPLQPISRLIGTGSMFGAIRRDDNVGDQQPHPSFALTRVDVWRHIRGDWRRGFEWTNSAGWTCRDTGGYVMRDLVAAGIAWTPWTRVNRVNLHPLWFGVYGADDGIPVAYHHGAGSRSRISRRDVYDALVARYGTADSTRIGETVEHLEADAAWLAAGAAQAESILGQIESDPEFWRVFA
jgi:hypothetical protein